MNYGSKAGALLAVANAGWNVESVGGESCPVGWVSLIEIPEHIGERAGMREAVFDTEDENTEAFDALTAGWYVLVQADDGRLDRIGPNPETYARFTYGQFENVYARWAEAVGEAA